MLDPGPIKRSLAGMAVGFVIGTILGIFVSPSAVWLGPVVLICAITGMFLKSPIPASLLIHISVIGFGWLHAGTYAHHLPDHHIGRLMDRPSENMELVGVLKDDPELVVYDFGKRQRVATLKLQFVRRETTWQQASGDVLVRQTETSLKKSLHYGERRYFKGVVRQKESTQHRGKTKYELNVDAAASRLLSANQGLRLVAWCYQKRSECSMILERGIESYPVQNGILKALLLGLRGNLAQEQRTLFASTGALHIFAVSGLHVGVFAVLFVMVFKLFGMSRPRWILLLAPALIMYVFMTGLRISAIRACLMAIVFGSAFLFRRRPDGLTSLALAAGLVLYFMPMQILAPGFLFSFIVVVGLIVFYRRLFQPMAEKLKREAWMLQAEPTWRTTLRQISFWFLGLMVTSVIAWLMSAPLTARFFNLFSPVALLANILVIPAAFVVVLTGCLSLLSSLIHPVLPEIFNHANRLFIDLLIDWIELVARIPGGHSYVTAPPWFFIGIWYTSLFSLLFFKGIARWIPSSILALTLLWGAYAKLTDDTVHLDVFDVGQGNAMFLDLPGAHDVLIDTGPRFTARRVIRRLRQRGVDHLDAIILTHADVDHAGGAWEIIDTIPTKELWVPPQLLRAGYYQDLFNLGLDVNVLKRSDSGTLTGDVYWEVLHPPENQKYRRRDDGSLVMRISREGAAVLIMGGAGANAEKELLEEPIDPAASVLILGNHGETESASDEFLELVGPEQAVISVGRNIKNHPGRDVLNRLESHAIPTHRTDRQGDCRIELLRYTNHKHLKNHICLEILEE